MNEPNTPEAPFPAQAENSYDLVDKVLSWPEHWPDLGPQCRILLAVIAKHANPANGWWCWPARARMAQLAGLPESHIYKYLKRLVAVGLLDVQRRPGAASKYRVCLSPKPAEEGEPYANLRTPPTLRKTAYTTLRKNAYTPYANLRTECIKNKEEEHITPPYPPRGGENGASAMNGKDHPEEATQPNLFGDEESLNGKSPDHGPAFEEFWKVYPRKAGKAPASKSWKRHSRNDRQAALERAALLRDWIAYLSKRDRDFAAERLKWLPHGSTFLNQERWADDPGAVHDSFAEWMDARHRPRDPFFDEQYETDVERAARLAREGAARNGS